MNGTKAVEGETKGNLVATAQGVQGNAYANAAVYCNAEAKQQPPKHSPQGFQKQFGKDTPEDNGHSRPQTSWIGSPEADISDIKKWVLLNAETMTANQWKLMQAGVYCLLFLATSMFVVLIVRKAKTDNYYWLRTPSLMVMNACFASFCLALLLHQVCKVSWRYYVVVTDRKLTWLPRRRMTSHIAYARVLLQTINVTFWLAQQVYILSKDCVWFNQFVNASTMVQWTCFNTIFGLDTLYAHCVCPWVDKQGEPQRHAPGVKFKYIADPIIMDAPFGWRHLPKLVIWLMFEASIIYYAISMAVYGGVSGVRGVNLENLRLQRLPNCREQAYDCSSCPAYLTVTMIWVVGTLVHFLCTYWFMTLAQERLDRQPYTCFENAHKMLMALKNDMGWQTTVAIASTATVFISNRGQCNGFAMSWLGILPLQMVVTATALSNSFIYMPRSPKEGDVVEQAWLRESVWTEEQERLKQEVWGSKKASMREELLREPVFCFSTAAKLLLWSDLVYVYGDDAPSTPTTDEGTCCLFCEPFCCTAKQSAETRSASGEVPLPDGATPLQGAPPPIAGMAREERRHGGHGLDGAASTASRARDGGVVVEMRLDDSGRLEDELAHIKIKVEEEVTSKDRLDLAMRLFGLQEFEVFHDVQLDTKVLVGWSDRRLVMAFRGTASLTNACADLKVWRLAHPPRRGRYVMGTRPMIHGGFLTSWLANDLNKRVVQHVMQVLSKAAVPPEDFNIYFTGHSLGGALATLAATEIKREMAALRLRVYTFGAPRTGNHAFAAEYMTMVPDTWHVINDRDAVPRSGKFFMLYKRPGHRVLINQYGDMRVRPDHFQVSLHTAGFSVRQHYLKAYRRALASIVAAQLMQYKGMEGGREAVEAFSKDPDMLALFSYTGINLSKLLRMPQERVTKQFQRTRVDVLDPRSLWRGLALLWSNLLFFFVGQGAAVNAQLMMYRMMPDSSSDDASASESGTDDSLGTFDSLDAEMLEAPIEPKEAE